MSNLTVKQKIILGVIVFAMLIVVGVYGFISLHQDEDNTDLNIENIVQNEQVDNTEFSEEVVVEEEIVVHITGAVQKTGILVLPKGARIADAIDVANGAKPEADLDEVNLAYVLQDGQKIYIPSKSDKKETNTEGKAHITSDAGNNVIIENENSENKELTKKVNINTATQSELENLPGIGPSIASKIIEYREKNGKFKKIEDLQNIKGIGDAKLGNIKEYIVVN